MMILKCTLLFIESRQIDSLHDDDQQEDTPSCICPPINNWINSIFKKNNNKNKK
jgi:hypothetical protein